MFQHNNTAPIPNIGILHSTANNIKLETTNTGHQSTTLNMVSETNKHLFVSSDMKLIIFTRHDSDKQNNSG